MKRYFLQGLIAILITAIALHGQAAAQSDAATIEASVTVLSGGVAVTAVQDLTFGSHFSSAGAVQQELSGIWSVETDDTPLDLTLSVLPSELSDGTGNVVPLSYGPLSFLAVCADFESGETTTIFADPSTGISDCLPIGPNNVGLGFSGNSDEAVSVDLTGAPAGTYTAVIELTATVR